MSADKTHSLTILLLKDKFDNLDEIIREGQRTEKHDIKDGEKVIGTLYVKPSFPSKPKWTTFFDDVMDTGVIGKTATVAAVLLTQVEGKIFAITFGPGRYLLKPDSFVERFGLRVALNSIGKEKIRTLDKTTFDAISRHSKEQASKETDVDDFGLDVEQDLLRAVTGTPRDKAIGKRIYGMDALTVITDTKIGMIGDFLERIYAKYVDDSYKKDFPWIDQIGEVKDKTVIDELDALLASKIAAGDTDKIWMAVPDIIEWDQVGGFCYNMRESSPECLDIHLHDFIESLGESDKDNISKEMLVKKRVHCIHSEGHQIHEWQAYKCLYAELEKNKNTYLLSGGNWYNVDVDFVASVNQAYADIPKYQVELPIYNDNSETEYNKRVSEETGNQFALMDRKNISYGGGQSRIEFCDLFSLEGDIVHVKRYGASSVFSHLFAQGRLSGELFQMDKEFREKVSQELPEGFSIGDAKERPNSGDYQVVFAIVSDVPGELDIPFFSKLNLKNSARNLSGLGYRVAKSKIEVDATKAKLKRFRERRKRR